MISSKWQSLMCACACSMALALMARDARSQVGDEAMARALFDEGRKLMQAGQYAAACPKFEAAHRVFPSTGVLMNLADCYDKTGRTASAWTTFGDAASVAARAGRQGDEIEAKRRQETLEPRLSRLTIRVAHEVPGLTIQDDGVAIPRGAWDVPIPVDPGAHELTAQAPDRQTWKKSFEVSGTSQTTTVEVPELLGQQAVAAPTPPPAAGPTEPQRSPGNVQHWVGFAVGGVGVIALVTGGVIGLVAKAQDNAAAAEQGTTDGYTDSVKAVHLADAGTVVFVAGAIVGAVGLAIWLIPPSAPVQVGTNGREALLRGAF
jgi:hypothetical protein